MTIVVDLKVANYSGNFNRVNTSGTRYHPNHINALDLYRHAIANTSWQILTPAYFRKYGWEAIYRFGIAKSLSHVDNIFALKVLNQFYFLNYADDHMFSDYVMQGVFQQSEGAYFLHDVCVRHYGPERVFPDVMSRLIKNPLSMGDISDTTRDNSYHVGMIFSRLYAEQIFSVPFLTHVRDLKKSHAVVSNNGLEPDLAGQDLRFQWHAFEGKGATNESYLYSGLNKAKRQLKSLASINGDTNITRSASGTLYNENGVRTLLRDPEPTGETTMILDRLSAISSHYKYINLDNELPSRTDTLAALPDFISLPYLNFSGRPFRMSIHRNMLNLLREVDQMSRIYPLFPDGENTRALNNDDLSEIIMNRNYRSSHLQEQYTEIARDMRRVRDQNFGEGIGGTFDISIGIDGLCLESFNF
ncbi:MULTISPECIES: hypothetical protein [Serratia]|uniref:hypothetical protein n=1 Tax=Serratia TaxID=613 RepID=UPI00135953BD|nr:MULTISPECIES: hypothetical protein [Serratia]QPJ89843.1 hypothetical protein HS042_16665 [Serratia marcescens]BEO78733.1 hypothetical protein SMTE4_47030 [Serratia marcescens]HAT3734591.1 hypothetical protein [Serratia marcescens]